MLLRRTGAGRSSYDLEFHHVRFGRSHALHCDGGVLSNQFNDRSGLSNP